MPPRLRQRPVALGANSQFAVQREEVAALYRGAVDAIYSDGALTAILAGTTGARRVVVTLRGNEDDTDGYGTPCVLTVSAGLIEARPDLVSRWVGRLLDAQAWAEAREDEVRRLFARETGLPEDLLDKAYSPRLHAQADVSLSADRVALLERKYAHLRDAGFLADAFDFGAFIEPGPLSTALAARAKAAA